MDTSLDKHHVISHYISFFFSLPQIENTSDSSVPSAGYQSEGDAEQNYSQHSVDMWRKQEISFLLYRTVRIGVDIAPEDGYSERYKHT